MGANIGIIGNGGQGRTLAKTIMSEAIRNSEEMKLLQAYMDTGLTPEEINYFKEAHSNIMKFVMDKKNIESKYNCLLGVFDKQQKEISSLKAELQAYKDAEEQGLLHKASIPNGTPIFTLSSDEEVEFFGDEPLNETSYLHGYTEYVYGQIGERWFLTREAAEVVLKEGK